MIETQANLVPLINFPAKLARDGKARAVLNSTARVLHVHPKGALLPNIHCIQVKVCFVANLG